MTARWLLLLAAAALGWFRHWQQPTDYAIFVPAGDHLWSGQLSRVYAEPIVQAGPVQLGFESAVHALTGVRTGLDLDVLHVAGSVAMVAVLLRLCGAVRRAKRLPAAPGLALALGIAALLGGWVDAPDALGHPALVVVPALWVTAGLCLLRARPGLAGFLIGLSTGWEIWGLLGFPLLFLAIDRRQLLRAALAGALVLAAMWGPFLVTGHFTMLAMAWPVHGATPVSHLFGGRMFTGPERSLQLTASLVAATVVAALLRGRSADGVWLVPLVAVIVRLWLDPMQSDYYWLAPALLSMVGCAAVGRMRWGTAAPLCLLVYAQFLAFGGVLHIELLAVSSGLLALLVARARDVTRSRGSGPQLA